MNSVQLYELSLAIGESLDMRRNCDRFLSALMTIKQLTFASVWIRSQLLGDPGSEGTDTATLLYAKPRERFEVETIPLDHPIFGWLESRDTISLSPSDPRFFELGIEKSLFHGEAALFALGRLGFLKMHSKYRTVPFSESELVELGNLIFKFTVSLEGCLAHHRLQREVALRRRAEAAARHGEERLRALIENALDLIVVLEYDGTVRFASPSLERILGYPPDELEGKILFALVHPDDVTWVLDAFMAHAREPGREFAVELRLRHRNGSWRLLAARANNVLALPSVAGIILNCNDITEHKAMEEALHRSEERYALAVRGANDGLWDWDLERGEVYLSPRWKGMIGCAEDEVPGVLSAWLDRVHPEDLPGLKAGLDQHIRGENELFRHEYRIRHGDGRWRWMLCRGVGVRGEDGRATRLAGSQSDITDLKERTTELEEARLRALDASRAKGEFLANMSHEIRTPMNAVIGMATLLLDSPLEGVQRDQVETIRVSGEALLTIVNDILDFSKIESGRLEIDASPFGPEECIESALDLFATPAASKGLELVLRVDTPLPPSVIGDEGRIRQIVINLVGNAIKFTHEGTVVVRAACASLGGGRMELQVEVADTGIGIPAGHLEHLFQPFSQADGSTSRSYGGSGLGLAICRRLCELMDGRTWVESTPGTGSTFGFAVAVGEDFGVRKAVVDTELLHAVAGRRLLVVDDHTEARGVLVAAAREWGMAVEEAGSRARVEELTSQGGRFDLALVDATLGGSEAEEVARHLEGEPGIRLIRLSPAVSATANPPPPYVATVTKPVRRGRLLRAFAAALAGTAPGPEASPPEAVQVEPRVSATKVLVAEDNPINLKLALMMLERLGYRADSAADGHAVLEAVARERYDLVLMDVQMPGMDGFEATRRLTEMLGMGRPRVVAMTAHALAGDRERCLAAGMDDYLSKPISLDELRDVVERHAVAGEQPDGSAAAPDPIDRGRLDRLRAWCGGGDHVVHELVEAFVTSSHRYLDQIRAAVGDQHRERLREASHSLKGGCLNVGADGAAGLARRLEEGAQTGSWSEKLALLGELEAEMSRVTAALALEDPALPRGGDREAITRDRGSRPVGAPDQ